MRIRFVQPHKVFTAFILASFVLAPFFLLTTTTDAAINQQINYQGKLTNASNVAVADGTYNMRFWLLTSPSIATTSAVWTESLTGTDKVQVTNGLFSVMLGSTSPLTGVDFNQTLYLGVEIGGSGSPAWDGEMSPRKVLGAVPAAFEAKNTQTFAGIATTSFLRSDQADTASALLTFTGGIISNSSSTITELTTLIATTTTFVINGEAFTDLTGSGLSNSAGALTCATSGSATFGCLTSADWTSFNGKVSSTSIDTSSELATLITDEVGTGSLVFNTSPYFLGTVGFVNATTSGSLSLGTSTLSSKLTVWGSGSSATTRLANFLNSASTSLLTIMEDGKVGIGSSTPSARLTIHGIAGDQTPLFRIATTTGTSSDTFAVLASGDVEVSRNLITAGIKWNAASSSAANLANQWRSVTYGNGLFVAVAQSGTNRVMTSPDGINWTARSASEANQWLSVTYGNGLFVAVSIDGTNRVMTSPDGITWTARSASEANSWFSVTYGNGLFVAVSIDGTNQVMTSPDGINWTARAASEANSWYSVTYGNGLFVAVSTTGTNRVMTSPDGINWTARSASEANQWLSVTYGNGLFVAVSFDGTNRIMTSPDGITWRSASSTEANQWRSVTYGNGLFVAVAQSGTNRVMTSPDGINWTARSASEANSWYSVTYGNGLFVAVAFGGTNRVMTSGKTFTNALAHNNIFQGNLSVYNSLQVGTSSLSANLFRVASTTGLSLFNINNNGNVGIGSTTPSRLLTVQGDGYFAGNVTAASSTFTNATTSSLAITGISGSTQCLQVNSSGVVTGTGSGCGGSGELSDWQLTNGALTPTSTVGIRINASSTIGDGTANGGLTISGNSTTSLYAIASAFTAASSTATSTFGEVNFAALNTTKDNWLYWGGTKFITASSTGDNTSLGLNAFASVPNGSARNLVIGSDAMSNLTGGTTDSTAIGYYALNGATAGVSNTAVGSRSQGGTFVGASGGTGNTSLGSDSLRGNNGGNYNTAIGFNAMSAPTGINGSSNVAVGASALATGRASYSVAVGDSALTNNGLSGRANVAVGYSAFYYNTDGASSTALGYYAGVGDNVTQNQRSVIDTFATLLGYQASRDSAVASTTVLTNITAIGKNARVGCSNCLVLGGVSEDAVNVGIGTTTPSRLLTVQGDGYFTGNVTAASSTITFASSSALTVSGNTFLTFASTTAISGTNSIFTNSSSTNASSTNLFATNVRLSSLRDSTNSLGTNGMVLQTNGSVSTWVATSTLGLTASLSGGTDGYLARWTSASTLSTGLFRDNGTVAGINATTSTSTFLVQGTAGVNPFTIASSTGSALLTVLQNGNVGIGSTTPSARLTIHGIAGDQTPLFRIATTTGTSSDTFAVLASGDVEVSRNLITAGIKWNAASSTEANFLPHVTYGNGLFVAVAQDGTNRVMTSPDGITWTARSASEANSWQGITYGNGLFVAVADSGTNRVMTSPDGITWTARSASQANGWVSVTYGNGLFVAVSFDGTNRVMTSPDGITWTARSASQANGWTSVTYGNGLFVAVSFDGTNRVMTSPDGITWTARSASEANNWRSITYGNGLFVAVAGGGTNRVMTSGKTFTNALAHNNIFQGGMSVLGGPFNIGTSTASTSPFRNNIFNVASTTGTSLFTILANGNVGIGSTTPSRLLTVQGDGYFAGNVTAASSTFTNATTSSLAITGISGSTQCLQVNSSGVVSGSGSGCGGSGLSGGTDGYLARWTSASTLSTGLFRDNGTVAGINATTSTSTFLVQGTAGINPFTIASSTGSALLTVLQNGNVGIGTTTPVQALGVVTPGTYSGGIVVQSSGGTFGPGIRLVNGGDGAREFALYSTGSSNGPGAGSFEIYDRTAATTRLTIDSTGQATFGSSVIDEELNLGPSDGSSDTMVRFTHNNSNYAIGIDAGTDPKPFVIEDRNSDKVILSLVQSGNVAVGTTTPWAKFTVLGTYSSTTPLFDIASSTNAANTATSSVFRVNYDGKVGIGTTSPTSLLTLNKTGFSGSGVAGMKQYFGFTNSVASAVYYGDETYLLNAPTATSTLVGKMIRIEDSSALGNTVRGFEAQAHRGTNTKGENTGLSGFGRTFGVRGTTIGDAGDTFLPAGVFAETQGTTQGNALRAYSGTITTEKLVSLFHDTSVFSGTGLQMNFGNSGGSFAATSSAKFLDFQVGGTSRFIVTAGGTTTIGDGTTNNKAGLQIGYGGLCVDNDGSCLASTTGRITSVTSATGNSDLAEIYFSSQSLHAGEIVALSGGLSVERADEETEGDIIGVVSTKPGLLLGFDDTSLNLGESGYPVGLRGRVPIKLSTENGPIKKGDRIALSSIPGIGMKATESSRVVGIALEDFDGEKAYSKGFLNQFGDDMIKERIAVKTTVDPRTQDGCSYGGGNALGEGPCVRDKVKKTTTTAVTDNSEYQDMLSDLTNEGAKDDVSGDGEDVRIGQVIMFIDLAWYQVDTEAQVLKELTATTTLDNTDETLWSRVKALAQNFVNGVLQVAGLKADRIEVKNELCVDGVCVTGDELRALLQNGNGGGSDTGTGGGNTDSGNGGGGDVPPPDIPPDTTGVVGGGDGGGDTSGGTGSTGGDAPVEPTPTPPDEPTEEETPPEEEPPVTPPAEPESAPEPII